MTAPVAYQYYQFVCSADTTCTNTDLTEVQFYNAAGQQISTAGGNASGPYTSGRSPGYAFNGNFSDYWECYVGTGTAALEFQFPSAVPVTAFMFYCRPDQVWGPATIVVNGSNDGATWTNIGTFTATPWVANVPQLLQVAPFTMPAPPAAGSITAYKYFRATLYSYGSGNTTSLSEIQFFDPSLNPISTSGGTATASSSWNASSNPPSYAFDGNESTWWACAGSDATPYLEFQFASAVSVGVFGFVSRLDDPPQAPATIAIQGSNDGVTWTTVGGLVAGSWVTGIPQYAAYGTVLPPVLKLTQTGLLAATVSIPNMSETQTALLVATTSIPRANLTQTALLVATTIQSDDTSYQHITLSQKPATDTIVELFELDCTTLGLGIYYWTPGVLGTAPYVYQGNTYVPYPINIQGWSLTSQGTQPRPKLSISNYMGFIGGLVIQANDLLGAKITRIRTYARFLDNGIDPDPNAHWAPETFFVDRKSSQNKTNIEWELATPLEQKNVKIPGRLCIKNYCYFRYRTYNTKTGVFVYNQTVAGCPWSGSSAGNPGPYFDYNDQPTTDPTADACSNQLTGCIARYGIHAKLPFSGFPGMTDGA